MEGGDLGGDGGAGPVAGLLDVVVGLEVEPELRGVSEEPREAEGGVGCDRALAEDDLVDAAGRDAGGLRDAILAEAEGLEELPGENGAGVDGGEAAGHVHLLVVVDEHDAIGAAVAPGKAEAPLCVHADAVEPSPAPPRGLEAVAGGTRRSARRLAA
jgi:hypothetical protein